VHRLPGRSKPGTVPLSIGQGKPTGGVGTAEPTLHRLVTHFPATAPIPCQANSRSAALALHVPLLTRLVAPHMTCEPPAADADRAAGVQVTRLCARREPAAQGDVARGARVRACLCPPGGLLLGAFG